MSLTLFTFLIVFGFAFLGQHQAEADCVAETSDIWKDDANVDEGSCPSLKKMVDETVDPDLDDILKKESKIEKNNIFETKTEVQNSIGQNIVIILQFLWQVINWWFNWK
ncbi:uncharacterized protein LOC108037574 isoform X1 [Drosophila rhopaloa]|uniref:Uncharacterized protein n=1 Tax=Drosophila rhopaloa TaxID=1041015 RepID=A0ABM5GUR4_DRORH|nr:uncharacterized protein LOC108037574 isoform X1 [Drosophila rhopaloa]